MTKFDRLILGITLMAFALSMLAISMDAFNIAGMHFARWTLILLGITAGISMLAFFVVGLMVLFGKRFREMDEDKSLKTQTNKIEHGKRYRKNKQER